MFCDCVFVSLLGAEQRGAVQRWMTGTKIRHHQPRGREAEVVRQWAALISHKSLKSPPPPRNQANAAQRAPRVHLVPAVQPVRRAAVPRRPPPASARRRWRSRDARAVLDVHLPLINVQTAARRAAAKRTLRRTSRKATRARAKQKEIRIRVNSRNVPEEKSQISRKNRHGSSGKNKRNVNRIYMCFLLSIVDGL